MGWKSFVIIRNLQKELTLSNTFRGGENTVESFQSLIDLLFQPYRCLMCAPSLWLC